MIAWLALGGAFLLAAVLLSFCLYEVSWKSRRVRRDLDRLHSLSPALEDTVAELNAVRTRIAARRAG